MINPFKKNLVKILIFLIMVVNYSCGSSGDNNTEAVPVLSNIKGNIGGLTGSISALNGWVLVLVDKTSGICRVSSVLSGSYSFDKVDLSKTYTLVLLSPLYKLSSVLSIENTEAGKINQYFKFKTPSLPRLIYNGPIMEFSDISKIEITSDIAADADNDNIPDGMEVTEASTTGSSSLMLASATSTEDTDNDTVLNYEDPDIDGDGIINQFDEDDDGDGIYDVFDEDVNGDLIVDSTVNNGQLYFNEGLEYIAVQLFLEKDSNNTTQKNLLFTAKVKSGVSVSSIKILGREDLFSGALVSYQNEAGNSLSQAWDLELKDDGFNYDDVANDNLYASKITLSTGKTPQANEALFVQLVLKDGTTTWTKEYPFSFPSITISAITISYDKDTNKITLSGSPFGTSQTNYIWSVWLFNSSNIAVFASASINASTSTEYTIPSGTLSSDETYSAKIYAQSLSLIPSYPVYVIESEAQALE